MTGILIPTKAVCPECERVFDLLDEDDAGEWHYGHDCEGEPDPQLPLDRPPRLDHSGRTCGDCGLLVILFDDDQHYCEATGTSTEFPYDYDGEDD